MNIGRCMKQNVISVSAEAPVRTAAQLMSAHHIGTLPVVDASARVVGLLCLSDLVDLAMPDFVKLLDDLDFVPDFGAVENMKPAAGVLDVPIHTIMRPAVVVEESTGLMRAAAMLLEQHLSDLPVVDDAGRLAGIASYVDIGIALMANWEAAAAG